MQDNQLNRLLDDDRKFIWHPYTQMKDCLKNPPILIERAKGIKLFDKNGKFYYDTISSWWCNVHGHNHPRIKKAIKEQLDKLEHVLFAGFTHQPAISLARKLISIAPSGLSKVFFTDNGSTSIEAALKMSFQYWHNIGMPRKKAFVSLDMGYHGDTIGAMSVSGVDLFNAKFKPLLFPSFKVASPYCYRCPKGKKKENCALECAEPLEALLEKKSAQICAILLEPLVMGASGMIIYPPDYLKRVGQLVKKYNIHLILDEVATGFGRTGKMFACDHVKETRPDFMCISKGITSGYLPMGAVLTTDKVYNSFYADYGLRKTFYHGHTYTANPISCAAAGASIDIFSEEGTLERVKKLMPFFSEGMQRFAALRSVGDVRLLGMIGALELVKNKKTKQPFSFKERVGLEVYRRALKKGLILRPLGNVVYLFLPLCIKKDELADILSRTYAVIDSLA